MSQTLSLITPPAGEPVTLTEFKNLLELDPGDTTRDAKLQGFLFAAREDFEKWSRLKLVTQTWLLRKDHFPVVSLRYDHNGYPQFPLPFPPFQSIDFFQYVDTGGVMETLTRDTTYGVNPQEPFYGYQLTPGGGIQPAWLTPPWARPWPPQRMVPANTVIQFRCGYGGPLTVSIAAGSKALQVTGGFTFNPDDAPALLGDLGTQISIPGAGPVVGDIAGPLVTNVASVDVQGNATLAAEATTGVENVTAWLGKPIPHTIKLSILFHAQFFFEQGAVVDQAVPRIVNALRGSNRNLVS